MKCPSCWVAFVLFLGSLFAQDPSRLDAGRITSGEFATERFGPARWLDGSHYATLEPKAGGGPLELVRYEAVSGKREVIVTAAMLWVAAAAAAVDIEDYQFSPDNKQLLVHGTGDDNVHFQHSERLFDELVANDKQFEYLAYPNRTHAIVERQGTRKHLYGALSDFLNGRVPPGAR